MSNSIEKDYLTVTNKFCFHLGNLGYLDEFSIDSYTYWSNLHYTMNHLSVDYVTLLLTNPIYLSTQQLVGSTNLV